MLELPSDFDLLKYEYHLPEEQIAQRPPVERGSSRLLVLDRAGGQDTLTDFADLVRHIPAGALFVANNSKVIPARLQGRRPSGGKAEFLLLTPLPLLRPRRLGGIRSEVEAWGLLKASGRFRPGDLVQFTPAFQAEVLETKDFGRSLVLLRFEGELEQNIKAVGHMPLPPYIHRPDDAEDAERYQTVYSRAEKAGSVAAPTAGLHFTPRVLEQLLSKGCSWTELTLYVGYGTFSPVRCRDIREHVMHAEYIEVSRETSDAVAKAKAEGRPVVAVGTTSVRALEGSFAQTGSIGPFEGWTDIFLYPGRALHVVDHLLTNFHLPQSSLLMLVSAMAGRERVLRAYAEALAANFRVFSYGDAMLLL